MASYKDVNNSYNNFLNGIRAISDRPDQYIIERLVGKDVKSAFTIIYVLDKLYDRNMYGMVSNVPFKNGEVDCDWEIVPKIVSEKKIEMMIGGCVDSDLFSRFCEFASSLNVASYDADFSSEMKQIPASLANYAYSLPVTLTSLSVGRLPGHLLRQADLDVISQNCPYIFYLMLDIDYFPNVINFQSLTELYVSGMDPNRGIGYDGQTDFQYTVPQTVKRMELSLMRPDQVVPVVAYNGLVPSYLSFRITTPQQAIADSTRDALIDYLYSAGIYGADAYGNPNIEVYVNSSNYGAESTRTLENPYSDSSKSRVNATIIEGNKYSVHRL